MRLVGVNIQRQKGDLTLTQSTHMRIQKGASLSLFLINIIHISE